MSSYIFWYLRCNPSIIDLSFSYFLPLFLQLNKFVFSLFLILMLNVNLIYKNYLFIFWKITLFLYITLRYKLILWYIICIYEFYFVGIFVTHFLFFRLYFAFFNLMIRVLNQTIVFSFTCSNLDDYVCILFFILITLTLIF
jgi:hypothetical protein